MSDRVRGNNPEGVRTRRLTLPLGRTHGTRLVRARSHRSLRPVRSAVRGGQCFEDRDRVNGGLRYDPLVRPTIIPAVVLEEGARQYLDLAHAADAARCSRLHAPGVQVQYLVDARADQVRDHHEAGGVEHLDEIVQILDPENPLQCRGAYVWVSRRARPNTRPLQLPFSRIVSRASAMVVA